MTEERISSLNHSLLIVFIFIIVSFFGFFSIEICLGIFDRSS